MLQHLIKIFLFYECINYFLDPIESVKVLQQIESETDKQKNTNKTHEVKKSTQRIVNVDIYIGLLSTLFKKHT